MAKKPRSSRKPVSLESGPELPRDLNERKRLFKLLLRLIEVLFHRPKSYVVRVGPIPRSFEYVDRGWDYREIDVGPKPRELRFQLSNEMSDHNLRVAKIAIAAVKLKNALRIAGLSGEDMEWWEADALHARDVLENAGHVPANDFNDYVHARGYSDFEFGYEVEVKEAWSVTSNKLAKNMGLIERLALVAVRLDRTISPDAVLERFQVDRAMGTASLDSQVFDDLTENELIYLHHLRQAQGEFISAPTIRKHEKPGFRDDRCMDRFETKYPTLFASIDVANQGSRIVLPMPDLEQNVAS